MMCVIVVVRMLVAGGVIVRNAAHESSAPQVGADYFLAAATCDGWTASPAWLPQALRS